MGTQSVNTIDQYLSNHCAFYNGDCCEVIKGIPDESIGLSVFSPPFRNLFIYSNSERDMGNANDSNEFDKHFHFLIPELLRITIPNRLCVVHCKEVPLFYGTDGVVGLEDFPGDIIRLFKECGWVYHSRVTIWKDPVVEMQRTKTHSLLYKSLCADSSNCRQGLADYLLVFRKWDEGQRKSEKPIRSAHGEGEAERFRVGDYIGTEPPMDYDGERHYSIQVWQRYASPVWFDIDQGDVLKFRDVRRDDEERHICPLQLGVIKRCVQLWSNPGDVVFTPFGGIGSEPYCAILMGRKAVGIELKPEYYQRAVRNIKIAEQDRSRPTLFDLSEGGESESESDSISSNGGIGNGSTGDGTVDEMAGIL
jgi:DNA modification methylase